MDTIIEAALSIAILVTSASIMAGLSYGNSVSDYGAMNRSNEAYDLFSALISNRYGACLAGSNATCISELMGAMDRFYGTVSSTLSYGNVSFSSGNASLCRYGSAMCMPVYDGSGYAMACVTLCD